MKRLKLLLSTLLLLLLIPGSRLLAQSANCPSNDINPIRLWDGFLTTADTTNAENIFAFLTPGPNRCIISNQAAIPQFSIKKYNELVSLYFDQFKPPSPSIQKKLLTGNQTQNAPNSPINLSNTDQLYHIQKSQTEPGDLTINTTNFSGNKTKVIFIDGSLYIKKNIDYTSVPEEKTVGLIFVVQGEVNVEKDVTRIDALIITHRQFCSRYDSTLPGNCVSLGLGSYDLNPLTINGGLVALNATDPPKFLRKLIDNNPNNPAEIINYQPKYLVIFSNIFSRSRLIWSELIGEPPPAVSPPTPTGPLPTLNPLATPTPVSNPLQINDLIPITDIISI